jgi:hypothetical protein
MRTEKKFFLLTSTLAVLALTGCSTLYVPSPGTPSLNEIPDFPAGLKVTLVNAQPNTQKVLILDHKQNIFYANLHDWTDRLNQSLKATLKKKGVEISDTASKSLKVSIEKITISGGSPRCALEWKVQLGDGPTIPMAVETGHWKVQAASDVAVRFACRDTLRNEQVRKYLSTP